MRDIKPSQTKIRQPTGYIHEQHGGENGDGLPFMTSSASVFLSPQTGDTFFSDIATLANYFENYISVCEAHQNER